MSRIVIIGWPKSGKTTLARTFGTFRSTDSVMDRGWSEASEIVATWFDAPGSWVIEGVAVPRALRKWRDRHRGYKPPVDKVIRLGTLKAPIASGAATMGKGIDTVFAEIEPWLIAYGVEIENR